MRRRTFIGLSLAALEIGRTRLAHAGAARFDEAALNTALGAIETSSGGRLGVALVEVGTARRFAYRGEERFPMCSAFKTLLAGAVLSRVDRGEDSLDRQVPVAASDIVANSPFTQIRVDAEAQVRDLCEAAMTLSDNAAANLLLPSVGGPEGLTRFARSLGDEVTRLDRIEPALNEAALDDPRDTSSPVAMAGSYERLVFSEGLTPASKGLLARWLIDSRTGVARIRAGLPADWSVGDKTGSGENGTATDVAVIWPPEGAALVLACFLTRSTLDGPGRNAAIASVARAAAAALG